MSYPVLFLSLFLAVLSANAQAQTVVQPADPPGVCREQEILVTVWSSQGVVRSIDYRNDQGVMRVDNRRWLAMPAAMQEQLALAAYCRINARYGRGSLEIEKYGRVVDGRWHNKLTR